MSADTVAQEGARQGRLLHIWTPEDKQFWEREGEAVAKLNLWISVPALFLAFAIWQVWSVVAVSLPGRDVWLGARDVAERGGSRRSTVCRPIAKYASFARPPSTSR